LFGSLLIIEREGVVYHVDLYCATVYNFASAAWIIDIIGYVEDCLWVQKY
jgi:hypothetical protein